MGAYNTMKSQSNFCFEITRRGARWSSATTSSDRPHTPEMTPVNRILTTALVALLWLIATPAYAQDPGDPVVTENPDGTVTVSPANPAGQGGQVAKDPAQADLVSLDLGPTRRSTTSSCTSRRSGGSTS